MIFEALVLGGTVYAGVQAYQRLLTKPRGAWLRDRLPWRQPTPLQVVPPAANPTLEKAKYDLALSSASLGISLTAIVAAQPLLSLASLPLVLYVFAPTYRVAYQALIHERRITNPVLDATRITLCVVMGYSFIGALNAWLQAFSQKLSVETENELQQTLNELVGDKGAAIWLYADGAELETHLAHVLAGDVIVLGAGDVVPADGLVLYGEAQLDQRLALGKNVLVPIGRGETVVAASLVQSGRLYVQLEHAPSSLLADQVRAVLVQTPAYKTQIQELGERSADRMAPRSLLAFVLTLPFLGFNHAAAFLCTGLGSHMRTLGPLTVRRFVSQAAQAGILIKDAHALEAGALVNTLILDSRLFDEPALRAQVKLLIPVLRRRPWLMQGITPHRFAIYAIGATDEDSARRLTDDLGLDDYLIESSDMARATLVERLQMAGRVTCYVGLGDDDQAVMEEARVAIALRGVAMLEYIPAQVLLLDNDLARLNHFFYLANAFAMKQGFNLLAPIGLDFVDLGTTLILQFGLGYSVLFNYSGLLLGTFSARLPLRTLPAATNISPAVSPPDQSLPALPAPPSPDDRIPGL